MSAASDARGLKRICMDCGTRFYDMNNRPIICPSCEVEFTGEIKVKGRRGRIAAVPDAPVKNAEAVNDELEDDDEDDGVELEEVSLDDIKDAEDIDEDEDDDDAIDLGEDTLDDDLSGSDDVGVLDAEDDDDSDIALDVKISKDD